MVIYFLIKLSNDPFDLFSIKESRMIFISSLVHRKITLKKQQTT